MIKEEKPQAKQQGPDVSNVSKFWQARSQKLRIKDLAADSHSDLYNAKNAQLYYEWLSEWATVGEHQAPSKKSILSVT